MSIYNTVVLALWLSKALPEDCRPWAAPTIGIGLRFGSPALNIGSIGGGGVKAVIDGLQPLLGGKFGNPDDWKIDELHVERACPDLGPLEIEISFWDPAVDRPTVDYAVR